MNERWTKIAFCPHCGNITTQISLYTHVFESVYTFFDKEHDIEYDKKIQEQFYLAICGTCKGALLYSGDFGVPVSMEEVFKQSYLIWPQQKILSEKIPEKIRRYYEEAIRIKMIAPNAYAGQIRKCLEALCDDRNIKQGSLFIRLDELALRGEIPKHFIEMANILRFFGNIGVHSIETNTPIPVDTIEDFFIAIIEYVYGFPSRIEEIKQSYKKI